MKELKFSYNGVNYTLAFTRESVKEMENQGFNFQEAGGKVINTCDKLFYGAFGVYHKGIKRRLVNEIWENLDNKNELIEQLTEMIEATVADFMSVEVDNPKKITWEVTG